ncbi:dihydroorotase [Altibacter sp. HG106]|uniref:dihydroorotase n=1 Tax=Altibacter sp. HG106 TaxID=3023937 RepID=UPI002350FE83|nr:dihydroorotase [Altibacter sp. HG106]MDC7993657.1 dihydroorotase [Altibacter sp. HG106]
MKIIIKSATIIDPTSEHHKQQRDLFIENGTIRKIGKQLTAEKATEITRPNLHVSPGWFDPGISVGEPGYEERETLDNALRTAALSGFAHVALNPNGYPVADSKSHIKFLMSRAENQLVNTYPIGAVTVGSRGEDLAELFDMQQEGAVAFYDYKRPLANANLLKIALQYAQNFDGLVQSFPMNKNIAGKGLVNEERQSTLLGLKGIPALSEELQIIRDLYILEYTGGKLHIPTLSTKKSVALIKEAKKNGLDVSCSVSVNNLFLTDDVLDSFDSRYKLLPPLRTSEDAKALIKGLKDGTIDGVTSDHDPVDIEHKKIEFENAAFGSIGLESCFGALTKTLGVDTAVTVLTRLKSRFGISEEPIQEGNKASLTLFDPDTTYTFSEQDVISTSKNAALLGSTLKGKAYGIVNNKKLHLHE